MKPVHVYHRKVLEKLATYPDGGRKLGPPNKKKVYHISPQKLPEVGLIEVISEIYVNLTFPLARPLPLTFTRIG